MTHCWPIYSISEAFNIYRPKAIDLAAIAPDGPFPVISEAGEIGRSQQNNHGPDDNILVSRGPNCGKISVLEEFAWLTGDLLVFRAKMGGVSASYARHYFRWLLQRPELIVKGDEPAIDRRTLPQAALCEAQLGQADEDLRGDRGVRSHGAAGSPALGPSK